MNNIFNENTDVFRKSQGPAALSFLFQQSYMTYKCENGQNDRHGRPSVKTQTSHSNTNKLTYQGSSTPACSAR